MNATPQRILLVDDEPTLRTALHRVLEKAGYVVRVASDGVAAVRLLEEEPADLVLTDLYMPDVDGLELILELRARAPRLPVVVMSGESRERLASLQEALTLGAVLALSKPFGTKELLETVSRALRAEGRASA